MSHCYYHALSSVKRWGGEAEDYLPLHQWFDESKKIVADPRHRSLRHHAEGIFMLETVFGVTIRNADGRDIPVRLIGEQHVQEDPTHVLMTIEDYHRRQGKKPRSLLATLAQAGDDADFDFEPSKLDHIVRPADLD